MNEGRKIFSLIFLALGLSLPACSGLTGPGTAVTPGSVFGRGEGEPLAADGAPAPKEEGSDDPAPADAPNPAQPVMREGGTDIYVSNTPFPSGYPAPGHVTPEHHPVIEGTLSVCKSSDEQLLLLMDGYARSYVGYSEEKGEMFQDFAGYSLLRVTDKGAKKSYDVPLQTKVVSTPEGDVTRTSYIRASIPLSAKTFPDCLNDLSFLLVPPGWTPGAQRDAGKSPGLISPLIDASEKSVVVLWPQEFSRIPTSLDGISTCRLLKMPKDFLQKDDVLHETP